MADAPKTAPRPRAKPKPAAKKADDRTPTRYVVLQGVELTPSTLEANDLKGRHPDQLMAWLPVMNQTAEQGKDGEVRVFLAQGQQDAIYQHTGKPPKPGEVPLPGKEPKPGRWKAVAESSWKGGERFREPEQVTIFPREALDD